MYITHMNCISRSYVTAGMCIWHPGASTAQCRLTWPTRCHCANCASLRQSCLIWRRTSARRLGCHLRRSAEECTSASPRTSRALAERARTILRSRHASASCTGICGDNCAAKMCSCAADGRQARCRHITWRRWSSSAPAPQQLRRPFASTCLGAPVWEASSPRAAARARALRSLLEMRQFLPCAPERCQVACLELNHPSTTLHRSTFAAECTAQPCGVLE